MADATMTVPPVRRLHMELRTGEALRLPNGVEIQLAFKKGQVARMVVSAPPDIAVQKLPATVRPVPSLPS